MGMQPTPELVDQLRREVDAYYPELEAKQDQYLAAVEALRVAKYELDRVIDAAYDAGIVVGKNEREREAHLRTVYPQAFAEVESLTRILSICERDYRRAEIKVRYTRTQIDLILGHRS